MPGEPQGDERPDASMTLNTFALLILVFGSMIVIFSAFTLVRGSAQEESLSDASEDAGTATVLRDR